MRQIGSILTDDIPATVAIHEGKLLNPIGIYYCEEKNILLIHGIVPLQGLEWQITEKLQKIFEQTNPWRIINLEGVGTLEAQEDTVFYFTQDQTIGKEMEGKATRLEAGIIIGISSSMLLKMPQLPILNVFAPTQSHLPDSKASAALIAFLDKYLNLNIDYQPLIKKAEEFEAKLKTILQQGTLTKKQADSKTLSYLG